VRYCNVGSVALTRLLGPEHTCRPNTIGKHGDHKEGREVDRKLSQHPFSRTSLRPKRVQLNNALEFCSITVRKQMLHSIHCSIANEPALLADAAASDRGSCYVIKFVKVPIWFEALSLSRSLALCSSRVLPFLYLSLSSATTLPHGRAHTHTHTHTVHFSCVYHGLRQRGRQGQRALAPQRPPPRHAPPL
jgi:hypothetical protein